MELRFQGDILYSFTTGRLVILGPLFSSGSVGQFASRAPIDKSNLAGASGRLVSPLLESSSTAVLVGIGWAVCESSSDR